MGCSAGSSWLSWLAGCRPCHALLWLLLTVKEGCEPEARLLRLIMLAAEAAQESVCVCGGGGHARACCVLASPYCSSLASQDYPWLKPGSFEEKMRALDGQAKP